MKEVKRRKNRKEKEGRQRYGAVRKMELKGSRRGVESKLNETVDFGGGEKGDEMLKEKGKENC